MSEAWTWTYAGASGEAVSGPVTTDTAFPTQSDAENWLGETWPDLYAAGVTAVTLLRDGVLVYGPMSLEPPTEGSW